MLRLALRLTRYLATASALLLAVGGSAQAATIMINNGLAPPNPANIIDYAVSWEDAVYVRNAGCPPGWPTGNPGDPCASPGAATEVELAWDGVVYTFFAYDSSSITMTGGLVETLQAYDFSTVAIEDWARLFYVEAGGNSTVALSGGLVMELVAGDNSTVEIEMEPGPAGWEGGVVSLSAGGSSTVMMNDGLVGVLDASDSATVTMNGGAVIFLLAFDFSRVTINDGYVCDSLPADDNSTAIMGSPQLDWPQLPPGQTYFDTYGSSTIEVSGGLICATPRVHHSSTVTIVGTDFAVDGNPVPYGDLTALTGMLTGTLASGDPVNNRFYQGGGSYTGTITLVPPPPIPVDVDIKPGFCPNSWNRESNGVLPVAILGTEDFDVTQIDVSSVSISRADGTGGSVGPNEGPPGPHSLFEDVGTPFEGEVCDCHEAEGDGILDLSMKFKTRDVANLLPLDDPNGALVPLVVSGTLLDGTPFASSSDCVRLPSFRSPPETRRAPPR